MRSFGLLKMVFDFLEKVFGNALPRIYPHIGVFERHKEVRTDWELEYDHTYIDLGDFCTYKNTYRIELIVGHRTRMIFEIWHRFGDRWYRLVDKVGKGYVSNRYYGGDGQTMLWIFWIAFGKMYVKSISYIRVGN